MHLRRSLLVALFFATAVGGYFLVGPSRPATADEARRGAAQPGAEPGSASVATPQEELGTLAALRAQIEQLEKENATLRTAAASSTIRSPLAASIDTLERANLAAIPRERLGDVLGPVIDLFSKDFQPNAAPVLGITEAEMESGNVALDRAKAAWRDLEIAHVIKREVGDDKTVVEIAAYPEAGAAVFSALEAELTKLWGEAAVAALRAANYQKSLGDLSGTESRTITIRPDEIGPNYLRISEVRISPGMNREFGSRLTVEDVSRKWGHLVPLPPLPRR